MPTIAAIGEVMIELSPAANDTPKLKALSFAGDTYNTAVCLARLGLATAYLSRLGQDPYSDSIVAFLQQEHIDSSLIERVPGKVPGLYMIHNSPEGEREFYYWRDRSPARDLFSDQTLSAQNTERLAAYDWLYFSGITLAILGEAGRQYFFAALKDLKKRGKKIAFDTNYRPRLWADKSEAQNAMRQALQLSDIALLTLDDEVLLWGSQGKALSEAKVRHADANIDEIVFKRGADDVVIISDDKEQYFAVPTVKNIVDTTAAGDTFNAGYLAARLQGGTAIEAAAQACRCANVIIRHRGGVIDKAVFMDELAKL